MHKYRETIIYVSLLAAFLSGILFMNLAGETYLGKSMLSLSAMMENCERGNQQQTGYLYYLLKVRAGSYLLLGVLGQIIGGAAWMVLYGAWYASIEGMLLASGFVQQQLSGVWFLILTQTPHMMLYAVVYGVLLKAYFKQERGKRGSYVCIWLANMPVILTGILAEYYISPWLIGKLLSWIK